MSRTARRQGTKSDRTSARTEARRRRRKNQMDRLYVTWGAREGFPQNILARMKRRGL